MNYTIQKRIAKNGNVVWRVRRGNVYGWFNDRMDAHFFGICGGKH